MIASTEPSPESLQKRGITSVQGAWHSKIWQTQPIYSVSYFNLGRIRALFWGLSPTKPPWRRDWCYLS